MNFAILFVAAYFVCVCVFVLVSADVRELNHFHRSFIAVQLARCSLSLSSVRVRAHVKFVAQFAERHTQREGCFLPAKQEGLRVVVAAAVLLQWSLCVSCCC